MSDDSKGKNAAAQELGRLGGKARASSLSASRLSEIGRLGAAARQAGTTPERRSEIARQAGKARRKAKDE